MHDQPTVPSPTIKKSRKNLLQTVADDDYGGDVDAMLEAASSDSIVPGICINCEAIHTHCEPDMRNGMCDACEEPKVHSVLDLAGLI